MNTSLTKIDLDLTRLVMKGQRQSERQMTINSIFLRTHQQR